jgi:uncharacterized membrane protein YhaH (DUF805 family)
MFSNPFSFEGRIRRTEYGLSLLIAAVGRVALVMMLLGAARGENVGPFYFILQLPILWFMFAQGAKRCHDVGLNGWYQLIPFFPLYLIFGDGHSSENEYGVNPKIKPSNF